MPCRLWYQRWWTCTYPLYTPSQQKIIPLHAAAGHALAAWFQRCCNNNFHTSPPPNLLLTADSDALATLVPRTNPS
jgi:hypothetical protein